MAASSPTGLLCDPRLTRTLTLSNISGKRTARRFCKHYTRLQFRSIMVPPPRQWSRLPFQRPLLLLPQLRLRLRALGMPRLQQLLPLLQRHSVH